MAKVTREPCVKCGHTEFYTHNGKAHGCVECVKALNARNHDRKALVLREAAMLTAVYKYAGNALKDDKNPFSKANAPVLHRAFELEQKRVNRKGGSNIAYLERNVAETKANVEARRVTYNKLKRYAEITGHADDFKLCDKSFEALKVLINLQGVAVTNLAKCKKGN